MVRLVFAYSSKRFDEALLREDGQAMVRIDEVAAEAGVSISTVSYAFSGRRQVSPSTREKVQAAAQRLGYRPNAGARALAGRRTHIFALAAPLRRDTSVPAHNAFVLAVATAVRAYDYDVLLLVEDEATRGIERVVSSRIADGFILLDVGREDERVDLVRRLEVPAVVIGVPADTAGLVCVDLDFEGAARMIVDRLASQGHRTIGLLGQAAEVYERGSNFPARFRDAFLGHAAVRGLRAVETASPEDPAFAMDAVDALTTQSDGDLTAIVMHSEEGVQRAVVDGLLARGTSVPGDLSLVSACSSFTTTTMPVPLDVVPLVAAESVDVAVGLLAAQVEDGVRPRVELIAPRYEAHGSVGAPSPAGVR